MSDQFYESSLEIEEWLIKMLVKSYTINDDLSVDVQGDVDIADKGLSNIPVQFGVVSGLFSCQNNKLTTLKGCPHIVGRGFECNDNKLSSLEYSPKAVGGSYICWDNQITSLKHIPQMIYGDFSCASNLLKSLEYGPLMVKGNFNCDNNHLTSLKHCPQYINGHVAAHNNQINTLEFLPVIVKDNYLNLKGNKDLGEFESCSTFKKLKKESLRIKKIKSFALQLNKELTIKSDETLKVKI